MYSSRTEKKIQQFLEKTVGAYESSERLAGDASVRAYYRVQGGGKPYVVCLDEAFVGKGEAEFPFFIVGVLLSKAGIPIPKIYGRDSKEGLILLEDGGDDLLQGVGPRMESETLETLYRRLIDIMVRIQSLEGPACVIPYCLFFDVEKLMYEFDFFVEHMLKGYYKAGLSQKESKVLRDAFLDISKMLHQTDLFVLNHRDYHSRNVLLRNGKPLILDFQDARMGLPQYDAVSLLRDSYFVLDDAMVGRLQSYHFEALRGIGYNEMSRDTYDFYFDLMGFQRNVKALGTFGYQVTRRKNTAYEAYIPRTVRYLPGYVRRREELRGAWDILSRYIGTER